MTSSAPHLTESELRERAAQAADDHEALEILRSAVATPSVTGRELTYARLVARQLAPAVADLHIDEFGDRASVWATTGPSGSPSAGSSAGARRGLLIGGHLDTVHVGGWSDTWKGTERESPHCAAIIDGALWGRGSADQKAGVSMVVAALRQLARAGLRPKAPVTTLFVADEESGEAGSGTSEGIKRLLALADSGRITLDADFGVYTEPTTLQIYAGHMGFFIAEVRVTGVTAYFGTPELGVDALKAATEIAAAVYRLDAALRRRPPAELIGAPFAYPTALTGGGYIAVPGSASMSIVRKVIPGEDLDQARDELDRTIRAAVCDPKVVLDITYPAGRDHQVGGTPHQTDPALPALGVLHEVIAARSPGRGAIEAAPYWSEAPFLAARRIPTVYFGPGDIRTCHGPNEHVPVADYLTAVAIVIDLIAAHCGLIVLEPSAREPSIRSEA
jgi:acetylornithine deacetylase